MIALLTTLWGALKGITGFGETISSITKSLADAKVSAINAKTEQERIAANERVNALQSRRDLMIAEVGHTRANVFMRCFMALPCGVLLWKVFVYDKAFGQWTGGRTDALSPELWNVITIVLGFYFLYELVKR
jgi:hypothetical protein